MGNFGPQKMLMCTLFWGEGSQKVHGLYNHENVDIDGLCLDTVHFHLPYNGLL